MSNRPTELNPGELQPFTQGDSNQNGDMSLPDIGTLSGPNCFQRLSRLMFQYLVIASIYRMVVYLNKLYQDIDAVKEYYNERDFYFSIISIACLLLPPLIYAVFLVGSNLVRDDVLNKSEIGTKAVNGLLLFFWQIKRHLDMLHFSAQRICHFRPLKEEEDETMKELKRNADVLEFFENFYAGFLQVLLQTYLFIGRMDWIGGHKIETKPLIYNFAGSVLSVCMLIAHLRRKDDGPLTMILSWIGWPLLIISRVLVFTLIATQIHYWLFLLCSVHVLLFSLWVYNIAIESYGISSSSAQTGSAPFHSRRKRVSLAVLVLFFFGIPSLIYWPVMFQLKEARRPLIYLLIITLENLLLLGLWFLFQMQVDSVLTDQQALLIAVVVGSTLGGVFSISLYVFCKPKYTDQVVLYEIRQARDQAVPSLHKLSSSSGARSSSSHQYGLYYDFCDIVFKLPSSHKFGDNLQKVRDMGI